MGDMHSLEVLRSTSTAASKSSSSEQFLTLAIHPSQGFGHGSVYKTAVVDLEEEEKRANRTGGKPKLKFSNVKSSPGEPGNESGLLEKFTDELDLDGLPFEGEVLEFGKPLCCMVDVTTGEHRIIKHKDHEKAFVETVRIIGNSKSVKSGEKVLLRRVSVTLRYPRSPVIGDKFSSRHGQKGTLSVLWPQVRAG
jgi:DNA-directed RNA polymerase I subunit RPA2